MSISRSIRWFAAAKMPTVGITLLTPSAWLVLPEVWMPLPPLGIFGLSQFSKALDLGSRLRSWASGGHWTVPLSGRADGPPNGEMQDLTTFQAVPAATWSKAKWEAIDGAKHTVKGGCRNTRQANQLCQNKLREHKAACNSPHHKQSFIRYPTDLKSSDAQALTMWTAERKQHLPHE